MNIHGIQSVGTLTQEANGYATLSGSFTGSFKGDGSQLTNLPITPTDTGSLVTTASFNAYTASQDGINTNVADSASLYNTKWDTLGSQSGSWVNVPLDSLNAFTASQETKDSTLASYTASVDEKFSNIGSQSGSWITESETSSFARTNVDNNFSVGQTITGDVNIVGTLTATEIHTIIESSSVIYSSGSNQLGDALSDVQTLSGSVLVVGNLSVNGTPVQTSSVDISALNAFTASQETKDSTLASYTASVDISLSNINSFTASQETKDSTLSTYTASVNNSITSLNSFTQSQASINSGVQIALAGKATTSSFNEYTSSNDTKWSNLGGQTGSYVTAAITASSLVTASVNLNTITFTKGDASTFAITVNTGSGTTTDLSSLNAFTASILGTNPWTASIDTKFATLGTQSGSWGGGGAFPYTGSAQITGSLGITGSLSGKVNALVVTGTTASLDFSLGNMFTLTLPSASTTYFNPANIKAGQVLNLQLTQQTPGTGSVSFAPSIKFAGGADYQATATGSAIDLVTFISLDGTNVLATSIKNFL